MRHVYILSFTLLILACSQQRATNSISVDSYSVLSKIFGDDISKTINSKITRIDYCPDNTCESFSMSHSHPIAKLDDFVYLYLIYVSDYYYLNDFKSKSDPEIKRTIIKRNIPNKQINDERNDAKYVLKSLAMTYSIKINFIRFDEGKKIEKPVNLE